MQTIFFTVKILNYFGNVVKFQILKKKLTVSISLLLIKYFSIYLLERKKFQVCL